MGTPSGAETINGTERLGWDQAAADAVALATIGYALYVDGARTELTGVTCGSAVSDAGFPCTAQLPTMTLGAHALELASFVTDGAVLESARSAPLHVTVVAQSAAVRSVPALRSTLALHTSVVADGLESPTDLAFAPDGRLFVAERQGRIRVVRDGRLLDEPAISLGDTMGPNGQLLAIALDPRFAQTHYVFAIYTALARSGTPGFNLARFREVADTLGDRAVILDGIPASTPSPSAVVRFGPDGQVYAAFDDGGDPRRRLDTASLNGKVLRLNTDGTTPVDARPATPVYADGYGAPVALDWDPVTATMWVADRMAGGAPFVFYRGALFPNWAGRMITADTLFEGGRATGVNLVAVAPDGAIYYGSQSTIERLTPAPQP